MKERRMFKTKHAREDTNKNISRIRKKSKEMRKEKLNNGRKKK
jgi:hypothetical protein